MTNDDQGDNEGENHLAGSIGKRAVDVIAAAALIDPSHECNADPQMVLCLARVRAACSELKAALTEYTELIGHG